MGNDLEKELLKAKMEIQKEIIKNSSKKPVRAKRNFKTIKPQKRIAKSADELRSKDKAKVSVVDPRLIKTPLDIFFYNYDFTKDNAESTPYVKFLSLLFSQKYKEAKKSLEFIPSGEEKSFDTFFLTFFSSPKLAVQTLAQHGPTMGKYRDLATFMLMAYLAKDLNLVLKVSEQMVLSNTDMELKFLNSINSYILKDDVIDIIPSIVASLRKFPKSKMLNNAIGYVNLKKGDLSAAKDYFNKAKPFKCSCANLEEIETSEGSQNYFCPKILYIRIRKMMDIGEVETAKEMYKSFVIDHPYKFLSYYYIYGVNDDNDEILLKFSPRAKFYYKTRLLATVILKSMKLVDSYKEALCKKINVKKDDIKEEIDIDMYEYFYQILGGLYCNFFIKE